MNVNLVTARENARLAKINRQWDIVRKVARAAISLSALHENGNGSSGKDDYKLMRKILQKNPMERTKADLDTLVRESKRFEFFRGENKLTKDITTHQHLELCRAMTIDYHPHTHSRIFEQGDVGHSFYIILAGSVAIRKEYDVDDTQVTLARLGPGQCFGELALMLESCTRMATAMTLAPTTLLLIHKEDFRRVFYSTQQSIFDQRLEFLKSIHSLKHLSSSELSDLALLTQSKKVRINEAILKQGSGENATTIFIIKRGQVKLKRKGFGNICLLGRHEIINDRHSFQAADGPGFTMTYSAISTTLVELYCISRHDLLNKLSAESVHRFQEHLLVVPNQHIFKQLYTANKLWDQYKQDYIWHQTKMQIRVPEKDAIDIATHILQTNQLARHIYQPRITPNTRTFLTQL